MEKLTPMMEQYMEIKKQHQDSILFFRLGDFYEMFFNDAIVASEILDITLTGKSCGLKERAPMCGVPFHSAEGYIQKLVQEGRKVAICEQVEEPSSSKGIVRREVIRIITPGTILDENIISREKNNFLMGISYKTIQNYVNQEVFDISFMDISTGDISTLDVLPENFSDLFYKVSPVEIILDTIAYPKFYETPYKNSKFVLDQIKEKKIIVNQWEQITGGKPYKDHKTKSLQMIFDYIEYTQKSNTIISKSKENEQNVMFLDQFSMKNLELIETIRGGKTKGSLFWVLNNTYSPMGSRMLKKWIEYPLKEKSDIENRLDFVETFFENPNLSMDISKSLKNIHDIERICTKLSYGTSKQQDILKLKYSLYEVPLIKKYLQEYDFKGLVDNINDYTNLYQLIDSSIEEENYKAKTNHIIRSSYNEELNELRDIIHHSADIILQIEQQEREKTGIKTLKVGFNKVFGYFIEITKAGLKNIKDLPEDYIRKQTLVSSERYINEELKTIEEKILTAKEKAESLEAKIYNEVKEKIKKEIEKLLELGEIIGKIDCYHSLAVTAIENNYVRPVINEDGRINITGGRHPVIEKMLPEENFVPNDSLIEEKGIHIITGPNMAGKSTYMRQVALISLMAHMGSFVPCESAEICTIDQIFTRVGASDDLSQGQSTFMVEMVEVSNILKNATPKSLIILDEIGRGTSTYDGMSIAYSIIEYIQRSIQAKSLVSTHYHEITSLDEKYENIQNFSMAVDESSKRINFLRKVIHGKSDKSYGIHVAQLAELPEEIIQKAYIILEKLEKDHGIQVRDSFGDIAIFQDEKKPSQLSFGEIQIDDIYQFIQAIDINNITPIEALTILHDIKKKVG